MMQIEWNDKKCAAPRDCRKCLDACPEGVFMIYPRDGRKPGKVAGDWAIMPAFLTQCTACKICEEICPQNALTVSVVSEAAT